MTLKELQQMIKEEFEAYQNEAADDVDVSVTDDDVDVDAELGDDTGAEGEDDVLRKIYDLLAAHFEGESEETGDEEGEDDDVEGEEGDVEETVYEEEGGEDIEENATTDAKFQKQGYAAGGKKGGANAGYTNPSGKGSTGYDAKSVALQERFQKLANIIK